MVHWEFVREANINDIPTLKLYLPFLNAGDPCPMLIEYENWTTIWMFPTVKLIIGDLIFTPDEQICKNLPRVKDWRLTLH